ncbi:MAG TPA: glycoside hydrolase family 3 C-terminal domain-containing protein [Terracidiphilus sp.]|nr:glycoside hydrolase family 3 C-terminal domain-containing protein [Terracidiphilus sp.]
MNTTLSPEQRANLLIQAMTLDEKITLMHGVHPLPQKAYVGFVPAIPRLGIPALHLADGRAGVGNGAKDVTLLPAPIAAASSWDPQVLNEFGKVLGQEQWRKGTNVELGPSIDVVRVPEWGRTFESYGEDPYLNGRMAAAEIEGIQSDGPIADANMYLTMNQESNRFQEDSVVDERTLHEIYLPPFAAAVEQGHVGTFMCAYVKTNGTYSCENPDLLKTILRSELKFDGWVMSDWGATHSTVASAENGLDQEMPGSKYYGDALKAAVSSGQVSMSAVDEHVRHILIPMFRQGLFDRPASGSWTANARSKEHDELSREVAEKGTVLLKNMGGLLPLGADTSIAVLGAPGGAVPKAEGGGSSGVVAPYVVSPLDGIRKRARQGTQIPYSDGRDLSAAAAAAKAADVAIVFVQTEETEGMDRPDLELPGNQDALIRAVTAANKKTIVVLDTGGPVLMPWIDEVAGVIEAWYPGQEDGNAIAAILYGDYDPSAKLPLTFPRSATAIPTASEQQWPGIDGESKYTERLDVGYRWYDATHTAPLFPFGFGLSYTSFRLSHLVVTPASLRAGNGAEGDQVTVRVDVSNTGNRDGAEVVQVYVAQPARNGEPPHQLRAFARVELKSGETRTVSMRLDAHALSVYDAAERKWVSPAGTYEVLVGTSSRDLPLSRKVVVEK